MVRRLLLIALVATLAVALPAAADEDPPASDPGPASEPCQPLDLSCIQPAEAVQCDEGMASCSVDLGVLPSTGSQQDTCPVYDLNMQPNTPTGLIVLDPGGCLRAYIRRTLGWPPSEQVPIHAYASPILDQLPW
ncbi:MAG: hypothetical protein QOJ26_483 [Thermoplasmata archaeon]|jgi:hypothetical protein|nr:hypothetical protein [Thermoplasmata archaeon]MEA3165617.1 hypothetical protein [Thermoplasmata archaeon]